MKFARVFGVATIAVLALAACGSSSKSSTSSTPTTTANATPTTGAAETTTSAEAQMATVQLAQNAKIGKQILVDAHGMTLYVWDKDKDKGKADCTAACAQAWPPLDVTGTATYGTGLTASMFSTVTGPNGEKQLAVNGKPLYHWQGDHAAGDATGQDVNGFYVVLANGNKYDPS